MNESQNFGAHRLMIVGGKAHAVQTLRQVLGIVGVKQIQVVADPVAAIDLLRTQLFTAVLCDESAAGSGDRAFGYAARRTSGLLNPLIPIFLVCGGPRRRDVEAARDLGFTDVLTRPVSAATIMRKLKLALGAPRPFIASTDFFGPDRRAPLRSGFRGRDWRTRKARQVKVGAPVAPDGDQVLI
jgi:CheY-like chemotaxis protein